MSITLQSDAQNGRILKMISSVIFIGHCERAWLRKNAGGSGAHLDSLACRTITIIAFVKAALPLFYI